jgi:hypothetical protein
MAGRAQQVRSSPARRPRLHASIGRLAEMQQSTPRDPGEKNAPMASTENPLGTVEDVSEFLCVPVKRL